MGDHFREVARVPARARRKRSFRTALLVGPVARRTLRRPVARPPITMAALFVAAMREWKRSVEGNIRALGGIQLRVEKVMDVTISREMERLDRRLLFLATVGSTAPFVGLFGTVWGIMTSFQSIAVSKNTSSRSLRRVSPRRCSPRRLASWPPFRRSFSTINFLRISPQICHGCTLSPTSSPPSYRARST